jgi:hypothetical protein
MTVAPGRCRDCRHRAYCGEVAECRPMVLFGAGDLRLANVFRCPVCRRVSFPSAAAPPGWCGWCRATTGDAR